MIDAAPARAGSVPKAGAGVQAGQLAGLVWFDMAQHDGELHQDWRLEDSPAGLAEFSRDAAQIEAGAP